MPRMQHHPHIGHMSNPFLGDFGLLPIAAQIAHGTVPERPTSDEFQLAAANISGSNDAASLWHLEAIRERMLHPGRLLDDAKRDINVRVARRLYEICQS